MSIETSLDPLASKTVVDTGDIASICRMGRKSDPDLLRFLAGFSAVIIVASLAWPFLPRRYVATTTIVLHPIDLEETTDSMQLTRQPLDESALQSEVDQINSSKLVKEVIAKLSLENDPEFESWFGDDAMSELDVQQNLLRKLSVEKERHSYTVKFGFMASNPDKAATLTKTLLDAYVADQLTRKRARLDNLATWLKERVDLLRAKSDLSQMALKDFLVESGLIDTGAKVSLEQELSTLAHEEALALSETTNAQARANALSELQKGGKLDGAPEVLASPVVQRLRQNVTAGRSLLTPVEAKQEGYDQQIALEADRVYRSVKTEAVTSLAHERALQQAIKETREEIKRRETSELHLAVLRSDADADRRALDDALVRYAGETAKAYSVVPDVDILIPPEVPVRPTFPNPILTVLGTLMVGCLAGATMIWRPLTRWAQRVSNESGWS